MIQIGTYYKIRQPGDSFAPEKWMQTAIKELWVFLITIWKQHYMMAPTAQSQWNSGGKTQ
jgi:hypothetical protein